MSFISRRDLRRRGENVIIYNVGVYTLSGNAGGEGDAGGSRIGGHHHADAPGRPDPRAASAGRTDGARAVRFRRELRRRRWHPRRRRGGGREAVRRAEPPAQAGSLRPVPRAPDSGKRLCDRPRPRQFLHAGHRPARCEARRRAGAHRAQPQFRLPLPAVAPAAATAVRPFVHPRDGVRHGGGPMAVSEPAVRDRPKSRRFARVRVRSRRARIGARGARAGRGDGLWLRGRLRAREEPRVSARCLRPRAEAKAGLPARAGGRWPASR